MDVDVDVDVIVAALVNRSDLVSVIDHRGRSTHGERERAIGRTLSAASAIAHGVDYVDDIVPVHERVHVHVHVHDHVT